MYNVKCGDLGAGDCDYTATGETREAVVESLYAHAAEAHPEKLAFMTDDDKKAVEAKINELLDAQEEGSSTSESSDSGESSPSEE